MLIFQSIIFRRLDSSHLMCFHTLFFLFSFSIFIITVR